MNGPKVRESIPGTAGSAGHIIIRALPSFTRVFARSMPKAVVHIDLVLSEQ